MVRTILEAVFESSFYEYSHGFRPGRSQHTALRHIRKDFKGTSWIIEGDIKSCFDRINHEVVLRLIRGRVNDPQFVELIRGMLKAKVLEDVKADPVESLLGTPQGGVISPLLSNIVLHELDKIMEDYIERFYGAKARNNNAEYYKLYNKEGVRRARRVKRVDPMDPNYRRMGYVRYADDFVIGVIGSMSEAQEVKRNVASFLKERLGLELNMDKTSISNLGKDRICFLGYLIRKAPKSVFFRRMKDVSGIKLVKVIRGGRITLIVDWRKVVSRLSDKGFCTSIGYPLPNFSFMPWPQKSTVAIISTVLVGLANYYHLADNKRKIIIRLNYILRFSLAKLFAAKFRLHSISKVFGIAGKDIYKPIKSKMPAVGLTDDKLVDWERDVTTGFAEMREVRVPFTSYREISRPDMKLLSLKVLRRLRSKSKGFRDPLEQFSWLNYRGSLNLGRPWRMWKCIM